MRHYYRFMELEPVLEMEEDSVGEDSPSSPSPSSSMGSPSLSPPPDMWAQLIGKEYQDSAYNMLLQDHLDLQRSFRLLEVQYRNCENRAARTIKESYAQVQGLKETLKEVLLSQETDKLAAVREELHRVKDREARLNEEVYDLREQNELLEFRILELEECNEHASLLGVEVVTCDAATNTDDVDACRPQAGAAVELERAAVSRPTASVSPVPSSTSASASASPPAHPKGDRIKRLIADVQRDPSECGVTASTRGDDCDRRRRPNAGKRPTTTTTTTAATVFTDAADNGLWMDASINAHVGFVGDAISCNLCRGSPRRRSLNADADADAHRPTLRKSKSDGEIKKLAGMLGHDDEHHSQSTRRPNGFALDQLDGIKRLTPNEHATSSHRSARHADGHLAAVRHTLDAIHGVLKETRLEVECTNSELREEVVTLEGALTRLTHEASRQDDPAGVDFLQEFLGRHRCSLSPAKDCHCCSQELGPALDGVLDKLQQLSQLVEDHHGPALARSTPHPNTTELTSREMESHVADNNANAPAAGNERAFRTTTEAPAIRKEIHVWSLAPDAIEDDETMHEESFIRTESNKVVAKIESMKNEIDIIEQSSILHQANELTKSLHESPLGRPSTQRSSVVVERPAVEENFDTCKPVLRRWREHLNSRETRAKSWAGAAEFAPSFHATATV